MEIRTLKNTISFLSIASICFALSACGGGGGSSGSASTSSNSGAASYTIGGTITGLNASGLVLQDNGGDALTLASGATSFTFTTAVAAGGNYAVTVQTQPSGENCTVTNATGAASANVTNVAITCSATTVSAPVAVLQALAEVFTALEVGSAVADLGVITSGAVPCSSGSVSVNQTTYIATYSICAINFQPGNSYSGTLNSGLYGHIQSPTSADLINISNPAVTLTNSAPLAATIVLGNGNGISATESLSGSTLTGTLAIGSLNFTAGSKSQYLIGNFSLGSSGGFSRLLSGNTVTNTVPNAGGTVTLGSGGGLTFNALTPIVWQGTGYPTSGSLQINATSPSLTLTVTFIGNGQVTLSGVNGTTQINETKNWTDADVQAALKYVTQ